MANRPKLLVDADVQRRRLVDLLDRLVSCLEQGTVRGALGDASLLRVRREREAVLTRLGEPFTLVILGDFKRGKSTLINALVGAEIAPTDVAPETVTINCYVHAQTGLSYAVLPNGTRLMLSDGELRRDVLVERLSSVPHRPTHVVVERPEEWLSGLRLVDTPGLGDLDPELARSVQRWLPEADAVLYVISALSPLSESERHFLKMSLAPADLPKIAFVVSRIDSLTDPVDVDRVLSAISERLFKVFPGAPIFPLSAIHPEQERFCALRRHLDEVVLIDRDLVKIERALSGASGTLSRARQQLVRLGNALDADEQSATLQLAALTDKDSTLRRTVDEHRAALIDDVDALGRQSIRWMQSFVGRLGAEFAASAPRHSYDSLRKHFPFYLSERLFEALNSCVDAHQGVLEARLAAVSPGGVGAADLSALTPRDFAAGVSNVSTPDTAWTLMDDLGLLIGDLLPLSAGAGLFSPTMALFGLTKGIQSSLADSAKASALIEHVAATMPELERSIASQVVSLYQGIGSSIAGRYDDRWSLEIEQASAAIVSARAVCAQGSVALGEVRGAIVSAIAQLDNLSAELDAMREDIAPLGETEGR